MAAAVSKALVVGGTAGIGYAIASRVAELAKSSTVTIVGRNQPKQIPRENIKFRSVDCASMANIKKFTEEYRSEPGTLDLLVLTQGILSMAGRTETEEGIDRKMALHYYGRQLFIRELTPILSKDAKVLIVLDSVGGDPSKLIWDDLDLKQNYSLGNAAAHCLTMNDAMIQVHAAAANSGDQTLKRHFVHAYPGLVNTNLPAALPRYLQFPAKALGAVLGRAPPVCAQYLLDGTYAVTAENEPKGIFWSCIESKGKPVANKKVWEEKDLEKIVQHTWAIVDQA